MKTLLEFSAMGLEPVSWSVPDIGNVYGADGKRRRFARRTKKSAVACGKVTLDDWQTFVGAAARDAMGDRPPFSCPVKLELTFVARTPPGHRHGELWAAPLEQAEDGSWRKRSRRGRPEPDATNLRKGTEDALAPSVYYDDVQVRWSVDLMVFGPIPGVRVRVVEIEADDFPGTGPAAK